MIRVFRGPGQPSRPQVAACFVQDQVVVGSFFSKQATLQKVIGIIAAAILVGGLYKIYSRFWQERKVDPQIERAPLNRHPVQPPRPDCDMKLEWIEWSDHSELKISITHTRSLTSKELEEHYTTSIKFLVGDAIGDLRKNGILSKKDRFYFCIPEECGVMEEDLQSLSDVLESSDGIFYVSKDDMFATIEPYPESLREQSLTRNPTWKPLQITIFRPSPQQPGFLSSLHSSIRQFL